MTADHELTAWTQNLADVNFVHQHVVDVQAAQQAGPATKPITLTFALVGLCLHLEHGWSGRAVQRAHMQLARAGKQWPQFPQPDERGTMSAADVVARPESERVAAIDAWCAEVWAAYGECHRAVEELLRAHRIV
ncbi:MAG: hypothetical protein JSR82_16580 [Verrucomicrobia bacterium]|nr:hypothetical protein [Verrucomicrobiota bacterium]